MYSCTNKVKHFYPSGKVRRHVPIKNGEISGHVISFHQNYLTNYIGLFIKNQREGIHRYFYSDNKLMYTGNYETNKKKLVNRSILINKFLLKKNYPLK